jgi:type IV secretion system protein VirB9
MRWPLLAALAFAAQAAGQPNVAYEKADARIRPVAYGQTAPVDVALGSALTLLVPAGERVLEVRLDDPRSFQVSVASPSDAVWVWPLRPGAGTQIAIRTNVRSYTLALAQTGGPVPYVARLLPPATVARENTQPTKPSTGPMIGRYKLSGSRPLRPDAIGDDGVRTYIAWGEGLALPAVFAVDPLGREQMVNGYMRDRLFVIDGVSTKLVFRIDRQSAVAVRSAVEN